MFAQSIIKKNLGEAQSRIDTLPPNQRLTLKLYSVEQSLAAQKFLESKMDEEKTKFIKPLSRIEEDFILNEITVCKNYFAYWAKRYAYIRSTLSSKDEMLMRFTPNIAQRMSLHLYAEAEEEGIAIMMQKLKARQLGSSTLDQLVLAFKTQFYQNRKILAASSDPPKTAKLVSISVLAWKQQPFYLKPEDMKIYEAASKEILCKVESLDNTYSVAHGSADSGIARGDTITDAQLTEIPDYKTAGTDIDASFRRTVHQHASTFVSLESTAAGKSGKGKWWWDTWRVSKEGWPTRQSWLRPLFLPYFVGSDLYPTHNWLKAHPVHSGWKPKETTIAHVLKCQQYVRSGDSPELTRELGKDWSMPLEQMWWYETERNEFEAKDELALFMQECCATPEEAFQRYGASVFSIETLERLRNSTRPLATWQGKPAVFSIIGEGIPTDYEPERRIIDRDRSPITIKSDWDASRDPLIFHLIPLHHNPDNWDMRLFIYEFPNTMTFEYANGIDCAEGIGLDRTVMEVIRKTQTTYPAEQVAEFATAWMSASDIAPLAIALGTFYSSNTDMNVNQCRQVIEIKFGGLELQKLLKYNYGWTEFHRWRGRYDNNNLKTYKTIGWDTNAHTRPMMFADNKTAIRDGGFRINSPFFIEELEALQKDEENEKIEAKGEDHDDRCIAGFMAYFSLHELEILARKKGNLANSLHQLVHVGGKIASVSHQWIKDTDKNYIEDPSPKDERMIQVSQLNQKYKMNTLLPTLEDEE